MSDHETPGAEGPSDDERSDDPVVALRDELDAIGSLPVEQRVARFERANEVLAAELAQLDEV